MAAYLAGAGTIEDKFECLVVIVHHCGIDASRPRGHTSLVAAVDVQIAVTKPARLQTIATVELAKDFDEGAEVHSQLEIVEIGQDPDGDPMTSLVVLPSDDPTTTTKPDKGWSKSLRLFQRVLLPSSTITAEKPARFQMDPRSGHAASISSAPSSIGNTRPRVTKNRRLKLGRRHSVALSKTRKQET